MKIKEKLVLFFALLINTYTYASETEIEVRDNIFSTSYLAKVALDNLKHLSQGADTEELSSDFSLFRTLFGADTKEVTFELGDAFKPANGNFFNIKATIPIDEETANLALGDLNTLRNKARVGLAWQKVVLPKLNPKANVILNKLKHCQQYISGKAALQADEAAIAINNFDINILESGLKNQSGPAAWEVLRSDSEIFNNTQELNDQFEAAVDLCSEQLFADDISALNQHRRFTIDDQKKPSYLIYGLEGTIAYQDFDYFDENDLNTEISQNKTDYKLKLFLGRMVASKSYLSASLSYQDAHTESDSLELCQPFGEGTSLNCMTKIIGEPTQSTSTLFALGYSRRFKNYAVQLKVTRNLDTDVTGVSIPVWLSNDIVGKLKAGVRLDWNSETDSAKASLFFNTPFKLK